MSTPEKPTGKQLAYLRSLADRAGETFTYPNTKAQASAQIRRLRERKPSTSAERRMEKRAVQREMAERPGDACRVDVGRETTGYGANAAWR